MPALWGGIAAAAIGAGGSMFQSSQASSNARRAQAFNEEQAGINRTFEMLEAQNARAWQQEMSNTAYQRAKNDMIAAGFNPMLAYQQGGASTPSGAKGSAGAPAQAVVAPAFNKVAAGLQSAQQYVDMQRADAETQRTRVQTDVEDKEHRWLLQAQRRRELSSSGQLDAHERHTRVEIEWLERTMEDRVRRAGYESVEKYFAALSEKARSGTLSQEEAQAADFYSARARQISADADIANLRVPENIRRAEFWKSPLSRHAVALETPTRSISTAVEASGLPSIWDRARTEIGRGTSWIQNQVDRFSNPNRLRFK